jgi:hypothetical protein
MNRMSMEEQVRILVRPVRDAAGSPTMDRADAIRIIRGHPELDESDYYTDDDIWNEWSQEATASPADHMNAAVLDRVIGRITVGR